MVVNANKETMEYYLIGFLASRKQFSARGMFQPMRAKLIRRNIANCEKNSLEWRASAHSFVVEDLFMRVT